MMNVKLTLVPGLVAALLAAPAFAQDGTVTLSETSNGGETPPPAEGGGGGYPVKYTARPLTLKAKTLRAELDIPITHIDLGIASDTGIGLRLGAAFGITDDLEAGATILPLALSPNAGYGDIPIYARYRFLKGNFQLGAEARIFIPVDTVFGFEVGLVSHWESGNFRLDVDVLFEMHLTDPEVSKGLSVPIVANLNFSDDFYAEAHTAINVPEFDGVEYPLGIGGFYTIAKGGQPMLDVGATFTFDRFISTVTADTINPGWFTIGLAGKFYLFL